MKFIKTTDGWYIDQNRIDSLAIGESVESESSNISNAFTKKATVFAFMNGQRWRLTEFVCDPKSTTQFAPKEAAQAWLDDFVTKLNAEENENGKSDKTA